MASFSRLLQKSERNWLIGRLLTGPGVGPGRGINGRCGSRDVRTQERKVCFAQSVADIKLMPIGVDDRWQADLVEPCSFLVGELQIGSRKIVFELRFSAPADDDRR